MSVLRVCLSVRLSHSAAAIVCGGFAAVGPAGRRYRSIAAAAACECGQCHVDYQSNLRIGSRTQTRTTEKRSRYVSFNLCNLAAEVTHVALFPLTLVHTSSSFLAFSALTLLVGRQEGHPACKKLSGGVLAWLSVWSEVQTCIWPS